MAKRAEQLLIVVACIGGLVLIGAAILFYMDQSAALNPKPPVQVHSAAPVQALDQSAEERAYEAMRKVPPPAETAERPAISEGKATGSQRTSLQPADHPKREARNGYLPPTTLALNCERLRKAYSGDELKRIPGYQEKCKG